MGVHIARWVVATLNLLVGLLGTAMLVLMVQWRSIREDSPVSPIYSPAEQFTIVLYLLLTVSTLLTAAFLLRRRTMQAGLKMHFGLANFGLLLLFGILAVTAWGRPDRQLTPWDLYPAYWLGAISGLWFGTGLTLKILLEGEGAKRNPDIPWRQSVEEIPPVVAHATSPVPLPSLPSGRITMISNEETKPPALTQHL